ncbi:MAG TPA: hypothetical protein PK239_18800 [Chitinophagales bacterium]|nr:hypothetical protein [Chitinophagales bacterium]
MGLWVFCLTLWTYYEEYLIYKHGDIVYATIIEEPYVSRKDCVAILQYQDYKSGHIIASWSLCNKMKMKYKKGSTYPVRYLKGIKRFTKVDMTLSWILLPFGMLFTLYFIYFTIKEHIKFFREEREKKQNTA